MATLGLANEGFLLLMRMMDVLEMITFDSRRLQQLVDLGVKEGALNIPRCLNALNRNKDVLIQRLNGKKEALEGVLKRLGARKTRADDVIAAAETAIQRLHEWTKSIRGDWSSCRGIGQRPEKGFRDHSPSTYHHFTVSK